MANAAAAATAMAAATWLAPAARAAEAVCRKGEEPRDAVTVPEEQVALVGRDENCEPVPRLARPVQRRHQGREQRQLGVRRGVGRKKHTHARTRKYGEKEKERFQNESMMNR